MLHVLKPCGAKEPALGGRNPTFAQNLRAGGKRGAAETGSLKAELQTQQVSRGAFYAAIFFIALNIFTACTPLKLKDSSALTKLFSFAVVVVTWCKWEASVRVCEPPQPQKKR